MGQPVAIQNVRRLWIIACIGIGILETKSVSYLQGVLKDILMSRCMPGLWAPKIANFDPSRIIILSCYGMKNKLSKVFYSDNTCHHPPLGKVMNMQM